MDLMHESGIPYWVESLGMIPMQSLEVQRTAGHKGQWLVCPNQDVPGIVSHDVALRLLTDGVEILGPAGQIRLLATDCASVRLTNVLLSGVLAFVLKNGSEHALFYNTTGNPQLLPLIFAFLAKMDLSPGQHRQTLLETEWPRLFSGLVPFGTRPVATVAQETDYHVSGEARDAVPCAVALSGGNLYLVSRICKGQYQPYGRTLTILPLKNLHSMRAQKLAGHRSSLDIRSCTGQNTEFAFTETPELRIALLLLLEACGEPQVVHEASPEVRSPKALSIEGPSVWRLLAGRKRHRA